VWKVLEPLLAQAATSRRRPAVDDRLVLEAIACILLNEVPWTALGTESGYGDHVVRRDRVRMWVANGAWPRVRAELVKHEPYSRVTEAQWERFNGLLRERAASAEKRRREQLIARSAQRSQATV
jgi:transposase